MFDGPLCWFHWHRWGDWVVTETPFFKFEMRVCKRRFVRLHCRTYDWRDALPDVPREK